MIFVLGDNHGHFDHIVEAAKQYRPSALISVGDITETAADGIVTPVHVALAEVLDLGIPFYWIPGNHDTETEGQYDALFGSCGQTNLDGRVLTLEDPELGSVRIAGLGGIFRGQVWRPPEQPNYASAADFQRRMGKGNHWRGGLPLKHRSTIFPDTYKKLSGMRADVLITHEAGGHHPMGFAEIDLLAAAMGVRRTFHGHHHDRPDYSRFEERDGFRAHGVGFCGITSITGEIMRPGDFDEERNYRQAWDKR